MESRLNLCFKIVLTLLIGAVASLGYLSQNERFRTTIQERIALVLERDYDVHVSGTLTTLSLWGPTVSFSKVICIPSSQEDQWRISMHEMTVSLSPLRSLFSRALVISFNLPSLSLFSAVKEGKSVLLEKIREFLKKPTTIPFKLAAFHAPDSSVEIVSSEEGLSAKLQGDMHFVPSAGGYQAQCLLLQGEGTWGNRKIVHGLAGAIDVALPVQGPVQVDLAAGCTLPALLKPTEWCRLTGQWKGCGGSFVCESESGALSCKTIKTALQEEEITLELQGDISVSALANFVQFPYAHQVAGSCTFSVAGTVGAELQGNVSIHQGQVGGWLIESMDTSFALTHESVTGTLSYAQQDQQVRGNWSWDRGQRLLNFEISNSTPVTLFGTQWYVPQGKTYARGIISDRGEGKVAYGFMAERSKTEEVFATEGTIEATSAGATALGIVNIGNTLYDLLARTGQDSQTFSLSLRPQDTESPAVLTVTQRAKEIEAQMELMFLQNLLHDYLQMGVIAQGSLSLCAEWRDSALRGTIEMHDAIIRHAGVYNFIRSLDARFSLNLFKRLLEVHDLKLKFQKGLVESSHLQLGYDPLLKGIWAHIPFIFSDCFVNWHKDLYLLFSGAVVAKKIPDEPLAVDGFVVIDKSQLKENIFSQKTQEKLFGSLGQARNRQPINARISVTSSSPTAIKTEQLETAALLSLLIATGQDEPELEGTITLQGGAIHFPAHSLSIVKGTLTFVAGHAQDPFLELIAQARIKKYLVTLSIGGTGQDPHLVFDSVPALSEEQIMMLLLAGSEEESLNIVAPTLVMRNVEKVIFGPSYRSRHDSWLEPLKRIRFVPRFADASGRGGFKGALEIEVSRKLRALIEKNFSLTEDVGYEVEYFLTDDVTLRASYDERGDLGAELEMRFKF